MEKINLVENKTFEINGVQHYVSAAAFYPTQHIGTVGKVQGTLALEIDDLFYIRMRITTYQRKNGVIDSSAFGPSNEYEGKNYNQAGFTKDANLLINKALVELARDLYVNNTTVNTTIGAFVTVDDSQVPNAVNA